MTGHSEVPVAGVGFVAGFASGRHTAPSATCAATTCSCTCEPAFGPLLFCIVVIVLQAVALGILAGRVCWGSGPVGRIVGKGAKGVVGAGFVPALTN